jgi:hypothetical protein
MEESKDAIDDGSRGRDGKDVGDFDRTLWTGRIITGLIGAFMLFDAGIKFAKPAPVADAFVRTGWPLELSAVLGAILLASAILYLIPQTAVQGAVLLTGYFGGAEATNLRLENPLITNTLFPVYFGVGVGRPLAALSAAG